MGNGQSAPAPRKGKNKLSKPKTKPTAPPISSANSPMPSRRNSIVTQGALSFNVAPSLDQRLSVVNGPASVDSKLATPEPTPTPTKKRRMSLFRSRSSKKEMEKLKAEATVDALPEKPKPSPNLMGRFTRSNSAASISVSPEIIETKSWAPEPTATPKRPTFHRARTSLGHVPYAAENANRLSLVAEGKSPPRPETIHAGVSGFEGQLAELDAQFQYQRTRSDTSLYAPIRRRSLLQHGVATRPNVEPTQSMSYTNSMRQSYYNVGSSESTSTLRASMQEQSHSEHSEGRTSTPNDLGHIGAFRYGSLRIVNGAASPTPSAEERRPSLPVKDHHIAAIQANSHRQGVAQRSYTISVPAEARQPRWTQQQSSFNSSHESLTIKIPNINLQPAPCGTRNSANDRHSFAKDSHEQVLSPFSFVASPESSPTLQATSKPAAEDDLFEADNSTPVLETGTGLDTNSVDSGYGPSPATPEQQALARIRGYREYTTQGLEKSDSGYNSATSSRRDSAPSIPVKDFMSSYMREPISTSSSMHSQYSDLSNASSHGNTIGRAIPMRSHTQGNIVMGSAPPSFSRTTQSRKPVPNRYRQSMPMVPGAVQSFSQDQNPESRPTSRQRPQTFHSMVSGYDIPITQQPNADLGIPPLPALGSHHFGNNTYAHSGKGYSESGSTEPRRSNSKETSGTIMSAGYAEFGAEQAYARLTGTRAPVPESIPEEDYHVGWRPPSSRRHTYAPSAPATPRNKRHTMYYAAASLDAYSQEGQTDFESHLTSFETISSSLGASPYDSALRAMETTPPRTQASQARTKSMTEQIEKSVARMDLSRSFSTNPQLVRPKAQSPAQVQDLSSRQASYNSIANGNPFANGSTATNSRTSSAGSTFTLRDLPSQRRTAEAESKRQSLARVDRVNSPPPVATQMQRKPLPIGANPVAIPTTKSPSPASESRTPPNLTSMPEAQPEVAPDDSMSAITPPAPAHVSPRPSSEAKDEQREFWRSVRESAASKSTTHLQLQADPEMARPSPPKRPQSAVPFPQYRRSQPRLPEQPHHYSFDAAKVLNGSSSYTGVEKDWEIHAGDYDHTYGSPARTPTFEKAGEAEYFEEYSEHKVVGTTEDMLVLDRWSGGLRYGRESPPEEIRGESHARGRSTGASRNSSHTRTKRKSVDVSKAYGLDFSEIPVFMQQQMSVAV